MWCRRGGDGYSSLANPSRIIFPSNRMRTVHTRKKAPSYCIGIITIPFPEKVKHGTSYVRHSYVKWFEEKGVRVIPIPYDTKQPELYFHMVNGLVIPGGNMMYVVKQRAFMKTITALFMLSIQSNDYFPIWTTCLGFEMIMFLVGGFRSLKRYDAHGMFPLQLTKEGRASRMMRTFPSRYLQSLEHECSTLQNHEYGISPTDFVANPHLRRFYHILATSIDETGKEFVSAIEAKHFPIYGIQFHPEGHKEDKHFIRFVISELKKNRHSCPVLPYLHTVHTPHDAVISPEYTKMYYFF